MKLVVIGRHGQLARSLQERAAGFADIELVLSGRPEIDLESLDGLRSAIRVLSPDAVLNAAAYTAVDQAEDEPERAWACNADAPAVLAQVTAELGVPMIHISTDYVFAGDKPGAYRESDPTEPMGVYGQSKLAGEERVRSSNRDACIVRTSWLFSPFARNFVKTMLALAETRLEVAVVSDQVGSPTSALDLADGLLTMASLWASGGTTGQGETYHLAGSGAASWAEVAEAIFIEARRNGLHDANVRPITTAKYPTKAVRPRNSVLDSSKFTAQFGFVMPDWRTSIRDVVPRCATN